MPDIIGAMRHRVEIWRASIASGVMGDRLGDYARIATVWASVRPDRGTTALEGQAAVDRSDLIITMRAHGEVKRLTTDDRLKFEGQSYTMRTIEPMNPGNGRRTVYCVREAPGRLG